MVDITGKKIVVGYWHNWPAGSGDGYQRGSSGAIELRNINATYNVVAVAFMVAETTNSIPSFKPYKGTDAEFKAQVGALNAAGRCVIISLGGAAGHIQLRSSDEAAFVNEIYRLVQVYGFDGLDIDLESTSIAAGENQRVIVNALKTVKDRYRREGKTFVIGMAPEFPYLSTGGMYAPYINGLRGYYDYIAPQLYNQGGEGIWVVEINKWLACNNQELKYEFLYYMADSFIMGSRGYIQIDAKNLALGIPANDDAAGSGYANDPDKVKRALLDLKKEGRPIAGLMTWSVNWDIGTNSSGRSYNNEFATWYRDTLTY